jgi:hypothetical protein
MFRIHRNHHRQHHRQAYYMHAHIDRGPPPQEYCADTITWGCGPIGIRRFLCSLSIYLSSRTPPIAIRSFIILFSARALPGVGNSTLQVQGRYKLG